MTTSHAFCPDEKGILYVTATPIGNLDDCSIRMQRTLRDCARLYCEDTRVTRTLCNAYAIDTPLYTLNEHNEEKRADDILTLLRQGHSVGLVSDAGTPAIADPGAYVVACVHANGYRVVPIVGPCAIAAAVSAAGFAADRFYFAGFLPKTAAKRRARLQDHCERHTVCVCYETPHRIDAALADIAAVYGDDHTMCLAKEISKAFESIVRGTVADVRAWLAEDARRQKGEFVLVLAPKKIARNTHTALDALLTVLLGELPPAQAARLAARISGMPKNTCYRHALAIDATVSEAPAPL